MADRLSLNLPRLLSWWKSSPDPAYSIIRYRCFVS